MQIDGKRSEESPLVTCQSMIYIKKKKKKVAVKKNVMSGYSNFLAEKSDSSFLKVETNKKEQFLEYGEAIE